MIVDCLRPVTMSPRNDTGKGHSFCSKEGEHILMKSPTGKSYEMKNTSIQYKVTPGTYSETRCCYSYVTKKKIMNYIADYLFGFLHIIQHHII